MNNLIVQLALLQVALPVVVIVLNGLIPFATTVGFALRTAAVLILVIYAAIAGIWLFRRGGHPMCWRVCTFC